MGPSMGGSHSLELKNKAKFEKKKGKYLISKAGLNGLNVNL
jgi:hypothetical protein